MNNVIYEGGNDLPIVGASFNSKLKSKNIDFIIGFEDGSVYEYRPKEDLTTLELSKILMFIMNSNLGAQYDIEFYFVENDLMRHFENV